MGLFAERIHNLAEHTIGVVDVFGHILVGYVAGRTMVFGFADKSPAGVIIRKLTFNNLYFSLIGLELFALYQRQQIIVLAVRIVRFGRVGDGTVPQQSAARQ